MYKNKAIPKRRPSTSTKIIKITKNKKQPPAMTNI